MSGCVIVDPFYELTNGYAICQSSKHRSTLIYNKDWQDEQNEEWGGITVVRRFFIKGFCCQGDYFAVYGTHTEDDYATDTEIAEGKIQYYLVNSATKNKLGPFESLEELDRVCNELNISKMEHWTEIS